MNRLSFIRTIILFICTWILALIVGGFAIGIITTKLGIDSTRAMRVATIIQDVIIFILPAILTAMLITRTPATYLRIDKYSKLKNYLLVFATLIASIPMMNFIIEFNGSLSLPESLSEIESWMKESEEEAAKSIKIMFGPTDFPNLIMSILIIGVLAGLSEELFFRGALQKILKGAPMNAHIAIWLTAFIFSAIHMQFYGFIPRMLLGAFFGYLVWWSGTLWLPIAAHIFNNTATVIVTWLNENGYFATDPNTFGATSSPTDTTIAIASAIATICLIIYLRKRLMTFNQIFCGEKQNYDPNTSL